MLKDEEVVGGSVLDARYDRQLRLWGKQGQQALQEANIVALGATVAVSEALKSIILTGVRSITVVDERTVTQQDVAHNFFLSLEDVGAPLAERAVRQLCELNSSCAGFAVWGRTPAEWVTALAEQVTLLSAEDRTVKKCGTEATLERISALMGEAAPVANVETALKARGQSKANGSHRLPSLILVSNRYPDWSAASPLVRIAANVLNIPVVVLESRGLTAYLQTFARDRVVLNPHPSSDALIEDLRIFEPFPALREWFDRHNPDDTQQFPYEDSESLNAHGHLPYISILYHAYKRHEGKLRKERGQVESGGHGHGSAGGSHAATQAEAGSDIIIPWPLKRTDFEALKEEVRRMRRREHPPQEGFQEALLNCSSRLNRPLVLQPSVAALFADPRTADPTMPFESNYGWPLLGEEAEEQPCHDLPSQAQDQAKRHRPEQTGGGGAGAGLTMSPLPDTDYLLSWFAISAIKAFYDESDKPSATAADGHCRKHKTLPFCGHVPDFITLTQWFQELRTIYQEKHEADVEAVKARVQSAFKKIAEGKCGQQRDEARAERAEKKGPDGGEAGAVAGLAQRQQRLAAFAASVTAAEVHQVVKDLVSNVWFACPVSFSADFVIDTATYAATPASAAGWQGESDRLHAAWRVVLRREVRRALAAFAQFGEEGFGADSKRACGVAIALYAVHEMHRRGCGSSDGEGSVFSFLQRLLLEEKEKGGQQQPSLELTPKDTALLEKICWEVERVGAAEVPSVAAVIGALAAQEVIKLVQRRRVPATYPMVYSGIDGIFYNPPAT